MRAGALDRSKRPALTEPLGPDVARRRAPPPAVASAATTKVGKPPTRSANVAPVRGDFGGPPEDPLPIIARAAPRRLSAALDHVAPGVDDGREPCIGCALLAVGGVGVGSVPLFCRSRFSRRAAPLQLSPHPRRCDQGVLFLPRPGLPPPCTPSGGASRRSPDRDHAGTPRCSPGRVRSRIVRRGPRQTF